MPEYYSRPLSQPATDKLIEFIQAYIESLLVELVDEKAEVAKTKAIDVLQNTDIDILVFVDTIAILYSSQGIILLKMAVNQILSPHDLAVTVVDISKAAHRIDKRSRMAENQ